MESWHFWLIAGIAMLILEIFIPGFLVAGFGIGAMASALAAALGLGPALQLAVFAVVTFAVLFGLRPLFLQKLKRYDDPRRTGVEEMVGKTCHVTETVSRAPNAGRVQIGGESWRAVTEDGEDIGSGEIAVVRRIEGATAYVARES